MPMMNMNSFATRQQNHYEYFTYIARSNSNLGLNLQHSDTKGETDTLQTQSTEA